jgi:lysophospholipase L1-like esterase
MRDPADPTVIRAEWKNDCYHPNAAGDRVMARAVELKLFDLPRSAEIR